MDLGLLLLGMYSFVTIVFLYGSLLPFDIFPPCRLVQLFSYSTPACLLEMMWLWSVGWTVSSKVRSHTSEHYNIPSWSVLVSYKLFHGGGVFLF